MSKGSTRRPQQVSDKEMTERWDVVFGKSEATTTLPAAWRRAHEELVARIENSASERRRAERVLAAMYPQEK